MWAVDCALTSLSRAEACAIDLETRGTDIADPETEIVGVGVAWLVDGEIDAKYFDWQSMTVDARRAVFMKLAEAPSCTAYNLYFDGGLVWRECARLGTPEPSWVHCSYGLMRQLATEDFPGQSWGLKAAQVDLLGWEETNEAGIDYWLISHGYHKQGPKFIEGEDPDEHYVSCMEWQEVNPETRRVRPDKSEMWRVPPEILGEYCILDCISTLQLYLDVLLPSLSRFPELDEFHQEYFVPGVHLLYKQAYHGIRLDRPRLEAHGEYLRRAQAHADKLLRESSLAGRVQAYEIRRWADAQAELIQKEPEKYKKFDLGEEPPKFKKVKLGAEPPRYTKTGKESKAWQSWDAKRRREPEISKNWLKWDARRQAGPEVSKNWLNWRARLDALESDLPGELKFNIGSGDQTRWLLYGTSEDPGPVQWRPTRKTRRKRKKGIDIEVPVFEVNGVNGWVELEGTDAGQLPTDGDLLTQLPEDMSRPLQLHADASQELGYVESYLKLARWHPDPDGPDFREVGSDDRGTWRLHPGWIVPGTKTGRLAGRDPSLHQMPKSIELLKCLIADVGMVWFEKDWSSVEPHVLAEISRDPALLKLYGPGAKKHCVYLYSGASYAVLGDKIRQYYDIDNPDVDLAKKECKSERDACKTVYLGKTYGAGGEKIHMGLRLKGFDLTLEQARAISDSHDEKYKVSGKEFHRKLEAEWRERGGWVLSALGHPVGCAENKKKDLINRVVQRSAHDVHTMYYTELAREWSDNSIHADGVVWDFHDQLIAQMPEADGERAIEVSREVEADLNEYLGAYVKLKGEPKLCKDMATAKEAEFSWLAEWGEFTENTSSGPSPA